MYSNIDIWLDLQSLSLIGLVLLHTDDFSICSACINVLSSPLQSGALWRDCASPGPQLWQCDGPPVHLGQQRSGPWIQCYTDIHQQIRSEHTETNKAVTIHPHITAFINMVLCHTFYVTDCGLCSVAGRRFIETFRPLHAHHNVMCLWTF